MNKQTYRVGFVCGFRKKFSEIWAEFELRGKSNGGGNMRDYLKERMSRVKWLLNCSMALKRYRFETDRDGVKDSDSDTYDQKYGNQNLE